jgi:hypothetical protein
MKFISEYMNTEMTKTAKVYHQGERGIMVIVKSDTGSHYNVSFENIQSAEDYAEDWVLNNE